MSPEPKQTAPAPSPSVIHNTFVLERTYPVAAERVFDAFADPAKKRRWFVDTDGHDVEEFQADFRVGGTEQSRFRFTGGSPVQGLTCVSQSVYLDIVPGRRIVFASTMTIGSNRISASLITVEVLPRAGNTSAHLTLTHQAAFFEGADGPVIREAGWRHLLDGIGAELATA